MAAPSARRSDLLPPRWWRRPSRLAPAENYQIVLTAVAVGPTRWVALANGLLVVNIRREKFYGGHYVFLQKYITYLRDSAVVRTCASRPTQIRLIIHPEGLNKNATAGDNVDSNHLRFCVNQMCDSVRFLFHISPGLPTRRGKTNAP